MKCHCGSKNFIPLGIQETLDPISQKKIGNNFYLVNCTECGTTLSCSQEFFLRLSIQHAEESLADRFNYADYR